MKKIIYNILALTVLCHLIACKKFLNIQESTSSVNPTTIKDFQEMLNSDSIAKTQYFLADVMSDDIAFTDAQVSASTNYYLRSYLWQSSIWFGEETDLMYNSSYSRILQMNIILDRVVKAPEDVNNTPSNRNIVIAQALINRAWYYLQLANAYGPAYNASTASADLAVPLVLTVNTDALPARASVEQVYTQVISDLKSAATNPYLPAMGVDVIHPGRSAAFALLSRAYLYKGDYINAEIYADSTLKLNSTLQNYRASTYIAPTQFQDLLTNPEVLMARMTKNTDFYSIYNSFFRASRSFVQAMNGSTSTLTPTDLRYTKRFTGAFYNISTSGGTGFVFDSSVSVPEIMLIKAECLARRGAFSEAGTILTTLRSNRLAATTVDNRTYTAANILGFVLDERRRELFFKAGLRLFDLKRYNLDPALKRDIVRLNVAGTTTQATLPAGSPKYLVPFSIPVVTANPNIIQNPR